MDTSIDKSPLLLARFSQSLEGKGRRPLTVLQNERGVKRFLDYLGAVEKVSDLREVDRVCISRYQSHLMSQKKCLKLTTQLGLLINVRHFFHFLEHENLILSNPASDMELPKKPKLLPLDTLSEREVKRLLNAVPLSTPLGFRDRAILEALYSTGIRSAELASLKLSHLDLGSGVLRIHEGKGGRDRVVPIGEVAIHYVQLYLKEARPKLLTTQSAQAVFPKLVSGPLTQAVFLDQRGKAIQPSRPGGIVRSWARRAQVSQKASAHMLRRSCATHMLRRNAPIRYIQELLGHKSLETTQAYTRVVINDLKKIHKKTHPREIN